MPRIGLFGGTFDPPHFGHLALAEWARERLRLDRVLFVPAGSPPHKRDRRLSGTAARVAMTRLAVRGNDAFRLWTLEVRRRGPSFTVDTLRALRAAHPRARLFLLMGEDSLDDFRSWHEPAAIRGLATLAVARRPGAPGGAPREAWSGSGARLPRRAHAGAWSESGVRRVPGVVWLDNPGLEVSSSAIRARVRAGRSVRYLVPDAVAAYLVRHRLYRRRP